MKILLMVIYAGRKMFPYSVLIGGLTYFISIFLVYNITKFDNYDYSKVTITEFGGYNFPIDKYSPSLLLNFCSDEYKIDCFKSNVRNRKVIIHRLGFRNSLVSLIISYFIFLIIIFSSRKV